MKVWLRQAAGVAVGSLAMAASAQAADDKPLWELGVGIGALQLPHYRGSDQSHTWLLPVPYAVYRGDLLKADRDGARATLFDGDRQELNLSLAASAPTRSEDNRARQGMADLKPTVEIGPVWNYTLLRADDHRLDLRWPVRAAFTLEGSPRHIGWVSNPHLNLDQRWNDWNVGLLAGPLFADRRFHAYFYDVTGPDITADRPGFRSRGGYAGWQATAALSRQFGDAWLGLFVKADRVAGTAMADSPLVRERQQFSAGVAVTWVFARSSTLVPAVD
ncbi:MipA/OmpV family protein [Ideonella sp. DXS29W]|uniref:MipA/OmpV family protein n=1 Tax=Ideonella lacteola TaxID=2984193 RepID=A0ABU9BP35_9BURK